MILAVLAHGRERIACVRLSIGEHGASREIEYAGQRYVRTSERTYGGWWVFQRSSA